VGNTFASDGRALSSFVGGTPVGEMLSLRWRELRSEIRPEELALGSAELSPRVLENGNFGYATWEFPYNLFRDTTLTGRFRLSRGLSRVEVPMWSRCRGNSSAVLAASVDGREIGRESRSLDTTEAFEAKLPSVLRGIPYLRSYVRRAFPVPPLRLDVSAKPGSVLELSLRFEGLAPRECGVSLTSIRLEPGQTKD
jgi:hypothetical protein